MATTDDVTALYLSILKRQPDAAGLMAYVAAVNAGETLADVAASIAASPEAQIVGIYERELGRAPETAAVQADTAFLARGGNLGAIAQNVGFSNEASADIQAIYQQVLERPVDGASLAGDQQALASGSSLADVRAAVALSPESQAHLNAIFQNELGRPATPSGLFTPLLVNGGTASDVRAAIANSPEASNDIVSAYQTAGGINPNPVEVAAGQSELQSGTSINQVFHEIGQLGTRSVPLPFYTAFATVTKILPETIGGSTPSFVYSLGNNDALISATGYTPSSNSNPLVQVATQYNAFGATIGAFNPATDVIQIQSYQAASFSALTFSADAPFGTIISLGSNNDVFIDGVSSSSLSASNFRFV